MFSGMQYRTKTCNWGNQTCKYGTGYGKESVSYCSGPDVEVCPLPYQSFGYFQELTLNGTKRSVRSSPPSCIRDTTMITDCDHYTISWTHWLDWGIDAKTDHSIKRSKQRYCLHDIGNDVCLFQEKYEEECCSFDPVDCDEGLSLCYTSLE